MSALKSKSNGKMPEEFFLDILNRQFGMKKAAQQLNNAIDWGAVRRAFCL